MNDGFDTLFAGVPVMAILRGMGVARTHELSQLAWDAGVTCVEVPLQSAEDIDALTQLSALAASRGHTVGAGTIVDREGVDAAVRAGALFTVSPGWDADVARASLDAGLPHLPGVATGTEVQSVRRFGLKWVKAFPAAQLGPRWITAMRGPFPDMSFVATGGVTTANAAAFLKAGASGVALGSALADADRVAELFAEIASLHPRG